MRGIIQKIETNKNRQLVFFGEIRGEDGRTYRFDLRNWTDKSLTLADIPRFAEVEFDLMEPNLSGWIYPKNIVLTKTSEQATGRTSEQAIEWTPEQALDRTEEQPSEEMGKAAIGQAMSRATDRDVDRATNRDGDRASDQTEPKKNFMPTNHHHGMLQEFAYIKQNFIRLALMEIIPNFVDTEFASESSVFWKIATTYNALQDEDFVFSGSGINESVTFPSGFETPEGEPILLLCKRNKNNAQPWVSDQLVIGEKKIASIFNVFYFNWYDVEQSVAEMIPEANRSAQDIVRSMEIRYLNAPQDLVYLQNGVVSSAEEADELYVPIGINMPAGEEIYLLCRKRNGKMGYGWYFFSATHENAGFKVFDKKLWLEKWSCSLDNDVLRELANQTMQERWSFGTKENFGILRSYLQYTFSHQVQKNKIDYDADGQYAAFNTGLPDRNTYKYLHAIFSRLPEERQSDVHPLYCRQEYRLEGFVVSGRGGLGKILSEKIGLPAPPTYFQTRNETVWQLGFNESNQITIPEYDDTHILIQRCERIPLAFYRNQAMNSPQLLAILDSSDTDAEKYKKIRDLLKPVVIDNQPNDEITNFYRRLQNALENVISIAIKRLAWNWRAVVPCYNPEREESCFLLPVSFSEDDRTDRAMIASCNETNKNNIYTIHTVIFLNWAYLDARLICRPESEWLIADHIDEEEE